MAFTRRNKTYPVKNNRGIDRHLIQKEEEINKIEKRLNTL